MAFAAGGRTLVTVDHGDGMVRSWDVETGKEQRSFRAVPDVDKARANAVKQAVVSPDGRTLAVAYQPNRDDLAHGVVEPPDTIRLWDIARGKEVRQLEGYSSAMAFSPDGRWLVTSGQVWDVATGRPVADLTDVLPVFAFAPRRPLPGGGRVRRPGPGPGGRDLDRTNAVQVRPRAADRPGLHAGRATAVRRPRHDRAGLRRPPATRGRVGNRRNRLERVGRSERRPGVPAQGRLLATPTQAIPLFAEKIKAVGAAESDLLRRLIAELGDAKFAVREAATRALAELGEKARPAVEEAARTSPSPEVVERAKAVLNKLQALTPEQLVGRRAVEVLERIGSDEAKELLRRWAAGVRGAVLTENARGTPRPAGPTGSTAAVNTFHSAGPRRLIPWVDHAASCRR